MGTRSLTVFVDDHEELAVMYRQYDGYPSGHGDELASFLSRITPCNGIPLIPKDSDSSSPLYANGMDCLAAQVIAHFKDGPGNIYLMRAGTRDCGEEYVYTVFIKDKTIHMTVQAGCTAFFGLPGTKQENMPVLYDGPVKDFVGEQVEAFEKQLPTPINDFIEKGQ